MQTSFITPGHHLHIRLKINLKYHILWVVGWIGGNQHWLKEVLRAVEKRLPPIFNHTVLLQPFCMPYCQSGPGIFSAWLVLVHVETSKNASFFQPFFDKPFSNRVILESILNPCQCDQISDFLLFGKVCLSNFGQ